MGCLGRGSALIIALALTDIVVSSSMAQPEVPDAATARALNAQGLQSGYSLDYDAAMTAFERAIVADPTDSRAYRLAAATVWIRTLFEQGVMTADEYLGQAK